jgi:hypothetical protein
MRATIDHGTYWSVLCHRSTKIQVNTPVATTHITIDA